MGAAIRLRPRRAAPYRRPGAFSRMRGKSELEQAWIRAARGQLGLSVAIVGSLGLGLFVKCAEPRFPSMHSRGADGAACSVFAVLDRHSCRERVAGGAWRDFHASAPAR